MACDEYALLIQADLDGELDAAATAALAGHLQDCAGCTALQRELLRLSTRLRREIVPIAAPDALRRRLEATLIPAVPKPSGFRRLRVPMGSFAAGAAIAAGLVLLLPGVRPDADAELLAGHIRALQPGHLTDVVSTDQHTVKPWFDGRIDYAPPVEDFAAEGFPLIGGRLDYIGRRAVAALVYRRDKHPIDLFVWPTRPGDGSGAETVRGFNIVRWTRDGMSFRAVSDLEASQLATFASLWERKS